MGFLFDNKINNTTVRSLQVQGRADQPTAVDHIPKNQNGEDELDKNHSPNESVHIHTLQNIT